MWLSLPATKGTKMKDVNISAKLSEANGSLLTDCIFSCLASAVLTLVVCSVSPNRAIPAGYLCASSDEVRRTTSDGLPN
jgi:hypothetical protein